ncbi:MAG: hypothetical protein MMC33_003142 [Icmadophila ericetorum]|nr:hypothetical protein [Icmadophila ericetorum]
MSTEIIEKQEFHLRNLLTRSVTLYPAKAQVVRDIPDITLKPGANQIEIYGITPTADEHSIKVDGKGAATITDMTVELIPNPDKYEELYPEESEDEASETEEENESETEKTERDSVVTVKLEKLETELGLNSEAMSASRNRLLLLDSLMGKVEKPDAEIIASSIEQYRIERKKIYEEQAELNILSAEIQKEIKEIKVREEKLAKPALKAKQKAWKVKQKTKQKAQEKKWKAKREKQEAKAKVYQERSRFWPKKVYKVVLSLDANSGFTPASSRRGSVDSLAKSPAIPIKEIGTQSSSNSNQISLRLEYVTSSASWAPHYDLIINSPSSSGTVVYRADFYNTTSETWKDCKVILSTSQTSFQGLGEDIPFMHPWHIRLQKVSRVDSDITYSALEKKVRAEQKKEATNKANVFNRSYLFGLEGEKTRGPDNMMPSLENNRMRLLPQQQAQQQAQQQTLFGSHALSEQPLAWQSSALVPPPPPPGANRSARFGAATTSFFGGAPKASFSQKRVGGLLADNADKGSDEEVDDENVEGRTIVPSEASLAFQESAWEESGLTATYEVPGLRTISPSPTARRHRITTIDLKDISLSYTCIPKLRTAAFLKASLKNTSHFTLLKGLAGLTLDGSFLGNTYLKRVSAGESLKLPLGVDPAIHVSYARPGVRKNIGSGLFNKEDSWVYTRSCTFTNSKTTSASPAYIMVIDQVPVSEDERLKVDILAPKGLSNEGDKVRAGEAVAAARLDSGSSSTRASTYSLDSVRGKDTSSKKETWGRAVATIKKAGEVGWEVWLEPGKSVRLVLEYETRFPASESVFSA